MNATTRGTRRRGSRPLKWFGILALAIVLLWCLAWFASAAWVEGEFDRRTKQMAREAQADIACGRRQVTGFPFAFHFVCNDDVMVETDNADVALDGITAGASIFSPGHITADLDGPANFATGPGPQMTVTADWTAAKAEIRNAFDRREFAFSCAGLGISGSAGAAKAAAMDATLKPKGADLHVWLSAREARFVPRGRPGAELPVVFADVTLDRLHARLLMQGIAFDPSKGLTGRVARLGLETEGGGKVFVSGPFSVSPEGRISGTFTIAVRDADALAAAATALIGPNDQIEGALTAFGSLGVEREVDGGPMRAIEIEARDGRIPFGFFSIDLPQLWRLPSQS